MKTVKIIFALSLSMFGCSQGDKKTDSHCKCAIPESVDKKTERGQDNSDQTWEFGASGGVEAVVKKAVDAKISVSGSYSNSNLKIEEIYREIIGSNPQITQKVNLYRSVACAYYEIACQDKTLNDKEKIDRLNEVVAGYEQNINKIINEEDIEGPEITPSETRKPSDTSKPERNVDLTKIAGCVFDSTNNPFKGVKVSINSLKGEIYTDSNGFFEFSIPSNQPKGEYTITFSKEGCTPITQTYFEIPKTDIKEYLKFTKQ